LSKVDVCALSIEKPYLASAPSSLKPAVVDGLLDDLPVNVLLDSGTSENFVDLKICRKLHLPVNVSLNSINMTSSHVRIPTCGIVTAKHSYNRTYPTTTFSVVKNLCSDVIVGQEFLKLRWSVTFLMNSSEEALTIPLLKTQLTSVAAATLTSPL